MLTEIFQYLRNWFEKIKYFADFTISDGVITYSDGTVLPLVPGQLYRIVGSTLNDGVHTYGDADLQTEEFTGAVWSMSVPPDVLSLCEEIQNWSEANAAAIDSPYQSESFGGYSYNIKNGNSGELNWQSHYASRLAPWRKI